MLMKWTPGLMWWVETGAVSRSVRKTSSISRLNSGIAASVVPNTSKIWPLAVPRSRIAEYKTQYLWRNIFFFHCLSKQINFNVSKNLEECMHSFDKFVWNAVVMKRPRNDQFISEHVSRENLPNFRGIAWLQSPNFYWGEFTWGLIKYENCEKCKTVILSYTCRIF